MRQRTIIEDCEEVNEASLKSLAVSKEIPGLVVVSFPSFYENMLSQVLWKWQIYHEKVSTEPCWSPSLRHTHTHQYHRGERYTNVQACRMPTLPGLSPTLTLPFFPYKLLFGALVISRLLWTLNKSLWVHKRT